MRINFCHNYLLKVWSYSCWFIFKWLNFGNIVTIETKWSREKQGDLILFHQIAARGLLYILRLYSSHASYRWKFHPSKKNVLIFSLITLVKLYNSQGLWHKNYSFKLLCGCDVHSIMNESLSCRFLPFFHHSGDTKKIVLVGSDEPRSERRSWWPSPEICDCVLNQHHENRHHCA